MGCSSIASRSSSRPSRTSCHLRRWIVGRRSSTPGPAVAETRPVRRAPRGTRVRPPAGEAAARSVGRCRVVQRPRPRGRATRWSSTASQARSARYSLDVVRRSTITLIRAIPAHSGPPRAERCWSCVSDDLDAQEGARRPRGRRAPTGDRARPRAPRAAPSAAWRAAGGADRAHERVRDGRHRARGPHARGPSRLHARRRDRRDQARWAAATVLPVPARRHRHDARRPPQARPRAGRARAGRAPEPARPSRGLRVSVRQPVDGPALLRRLRRHRRRHRHRHAAGVGAAGRRGRAAGCDQGRAGAHALPRAPPGADRGHPAPLRPPRCARRADRRRRGRLRRAARGRASSRSPTRSRSRRAARRRSTARW